MPFHASSAIPAEQYQRAKKLAIQTKMAAESRSAAYSTGANASAILSLADNLRSQRAALIACTNVPGIAVYAAAQEDDSEYNVAAEFSSMIAAIDDVISEIVTAIPKDGNGWLLINKLNASGEMQPRSFTGAALANLRVKLDALAASID